MVRLLIPILLALGLSACVRGPDRLPFDGVYFRATAKPIERADRAAFEVTVRRATQSVEGARQAALHEATKYCIRWFGLSDVAWQVSPMDEALRIQDDRLIARGTCTG